MFMFGTFYVRVRGENLKGTGQGDGSFFPSHHSLPIDKMEFDGTRTPVP